MNKKITYSSGENKSLITLKKTYGKNELVMLFQTREDQARTEEDGAVVLPMTFIASLNPVDEEIEKIEIGGFDSLWDWTSVTYSLSFSLFHGEVDKYSVEESSAYIARGIVNGKATSVSSDVYNKEKAVIDVVSIK